MRLVIELMPSIRRHERRSPLDAFTGRFMRRFERRLRRMGWLVCRVSTETS